MCIAAAIPMIAGATGISASTLGTASLVAQGVSTGLSVIGALQSSAAQEGQYEYQAAVDRNNAELSRQAAEDARTRGQMEENALRHKIRSTQASQRVGFAANGIDLGSDVALDTMADTAFIGELDALTLKQNTANEVWKYRNESQNYMSSAAMKENAADNASTAGWITAGSNILGGASTISDRWATYKRTGVFAP